MARPSPLVRYAVSQVRSGRRVGCRLNSHDVLSEYAQRQKGIQIERLDHLDLDGEWRAALVEDHSTPVVEQAAFRIDFPAWLNRLAPRQRQIVKFLALDNSTSEAARHFRLSAPRISQLRRELHHDWMQFHGEAIRAGRAKTGTALRPACTKDHFTKHQGNDEMNPSPIDRIVSSVTDESMQEISRRSFSLADLIEVDYDPESEVSPQVVDWDELDAQRPSLFP
jgi:hypothetical protein